MITFYLVIGEVYNRTRVDWMVTVKLTNDSMVEMQSYLNVDDN